MRVYFVLVSIFLIILLSSISYAAIEFSVGVSPPVVDLGEVEKGSSKIVKLFLVTPSTEPLLIYLEKERGNLDFFGRDQYRNLTFNYSEQDTVSWAEFLKNPIELTPANETLKTKAGEIKGWREVDFLLNVPKDAEPGYHITRINPLPTIPSEAIGQTGARVVAITSVTVLFKVPGDSIREGIILDVNPGDYVGDRLEINTHFQNTGTTTISARAYQNVYRNGESIENISSPTEYIKPGEIKILKSYLSRDKISVGNYNVFTTVDYTTDYITKNSTMSITSRLPTVTKPTEEFPYWIIILIVIIIIAIFIYRWYR